jgi:hypothetical protein
MTTKAKKLKDELCIQGKQECAGMKLALEGNQRFGLQHAFSINTKKPEMITSDIAYRPDRKGAKLIIINFCPFCGRALSKQAEEFDKNRRRLERQNARAS